MNRDTLIAYLVHQLPEDERAAVAERLMSDPAVHEELRLAEGELLDEYVRGTLPAHQRALVEQYMLASEAQHQKLAFATALQATMSRKRRAAVSWLAVAAAASFVVLGGSTAWLIVQNGRLREALATPRAASTAPTGAVYAVFITADAVRGATERTVVAIPSTAEVVRLDLELEAGDERQTLSGSVAQAGKVVWRQTPVVATPRGGAHVASLWIPTPLVAAGAAEATLEAGGQPIAFYHFAVER